MPRRKKNIFNPNTDSSLGFDWSEPKTIEYEEASFDPSSQRGVPDEKTFNGFTWLLVAVGLFFGAYFIKLVDLTVVQHQQLLARAEGNRLRSQFVPAPRGVIYDRNGQIIAHNKPSFDLIITPLDLPADEEQLSLVLLGIADFFDLTTDELQEAFEGVSRDSFLPLTIIRDLPQPKAVAFITSGGYFPGFSIQDNPIRLYEDGPVFAHLIGYTGKLSEAEYAELRDQGYLFNDEIGKNGLELTYEELLRGRYGERLVEVDATGNLVDIFRQRVPLPGSDIYLNVDAELQKVVYESLTKHMTLQRAKKGAAVALDPRTGGVLALVSIPSYDNNWFAGGIDNDQYLQLTENENLPLFNRVTSGTYPPGSTIKPFEAAAALQEGVVDEDDLIFDNGALVVPNQFNPALSQTFRGWKPGGLGNVNVRQAIAQSSDIYFYTVGGGQEELNIDGLGPDRLARYLNAFFLGRATGIDLPSEKVGLVPTPTWKEQRFADSPIERRWYLGDTYNMSIGQGFNLATPLQIAVATAAVANKGEVLKPQIVARTVDSETREEQKFEKQILNSKFLDKKYLEVSREGMRMAVTEGTSRFLNSLIIPVAGKTGTSQFDGSDLSRTHAWFTSFAPYEDPEIVLTVLVEAGGEGSSISVPVARDVYEWYQNNRYQR